MIELSSAYADALLLKVYGLSKDELGKLTQRQYNELLDNLGGVISFEQVGKVHDAEKEREKDLKNLEWVRNRKKKLKEGNNHG